MSRNKRQTFSNMYKEEKINKNRVYLIIFFIPKTSCIGRGGTVSNLSFVDIAARFRLPEVCPSNNSLADTIRPSGTLPDTER